MSKNYRNSIREQLKTAPGREIHLPEGSRHYQIETDRLSKDKQPETYTE